MKSDQRELLRYAVSHGDKDTILATCGILLRNGVPQREIMLVIEEFLDDDAVIAQLKHQIMQVPQEQKPARITDRLSSVDTGLPGRSRRGSLLGGVFIVLLLALLLAGMLGLYPGGYLWQALLPP